MQKIYELKGQTYNQNTLGNVKTIKKKSIHNN